MLGTIMKSLETGAWLGAAVVLAIGAYSGGTQNISLAAEVESIKRTGSIERRYVTDVRRAEWYRTLWTMGETCGGPFILALVGDDCERCDEMLDTLKSLQTGGVGECTEIWAIGLEGDTPRLRDMTRALQTGVGRLRVLTPVDKQTFSMRSGLQQLMVVIVDSNDTVLSIVRGMPVGEQIDQLRLRMRRSSQAGAPLVMDGLRNPPKPRPSTGAR